MEKEAKEAIIQAVEYMDNLKKGIELIDYNYRGGDYYKAKGYMKDFVEGLMWLNEVLTYTKSYHQVNPLELMDVFKEMIIAFENSDTVMLADLLQYEILPIIEQWQVKLKKEVNGYIK